MNEAIKHFASSQADYQSNLRIIGAYLTGRESLFGQLVAAYWMARILKRCVK